MAQRIIRNDFVAGEISPELWGRHDVEMYYHGAARIENFIPRRTGGLRKRAGTELVWHIAGTEARDYRIVPYRYDKDHYGLLALYRKEPAQPVYWRFWSSKTGTATSEAGVSFLSIPSDISLSALRHEQIGDTIYFTLHGRRAFTAKVTYATPAVEWAQLHTEIAVAAPPALSTTASGFKAAGGNYISAYREYALWGVKDGIRSAIRTRRQSMTLEWVAGAYIDVTFTPNWACHDYYILAKLQGGQYGEVARFYPDLDNGSRSDIAQFYGGTQSASGTMDGTTYTAATGDVTTLWKSTDPDATNAAGQHTCGSWVMSVGARHASGTAPVLSIKAWFGAKMTYQATDENNETTTEVASVGLTSQVHAVLYKGNGSGDIIAEWTLTPAYSDVPTKLSITSPVANDGGYALHFYADNTRTIPVYVPMRGLVLCTDVGIKTFHDDNIQPGTLVGDQDLLQVGNQGMDVDLITTWQQRLIAASSSDMPFTMWFSAVGDLSNFYVDRPQTADNAFEATIASTEANKIIHLVAQKWLLAFTESGEYTIGSTNGALAHNTVDVKKISSVGAHDGIPPCTTESEVLFVAHDARSVYKLDYTLERDSVVPTNLSVRAEHVAARHGIAAIAYQRYPDSVLWCLLSDGSLASLTFFPEEDVCAWARHTLAGGGGLKAEDMFCTGRVRSEEDTASTSEIILVFRHPDQPGDVWVERLRPNVMVDTPSTSAAICADHMGYEDGDCPNGADPQGDVEASVETIRVEPQQVDTIGAMTAQFGAVLRILRSGKVSVRPVLQVPNENTWRDATLLPQTGENGKVSLVRGDARIATAVVNNREGRFEIKSDDAYPCDILALCVSGNFGTMRDGG